MVKRKHADLFCDLASFSSDEAAAPVVTANASTQTEPVPNTYSSATSSSTAADIWVPPYSSDGYVVAYDFTKEIQSGIKVFFPNFKQGTTPTSGRILEHSRAVVSNCIDKRGGEQKAVFKIGIATSMIDRQEDYMENGYAEVRVALASLHLPLVEMLEAALIALFEHCPGNHAVQSGGDGGLSKRSHYKAQSASPVFFCMLLLNRQTSLTLLAFLCVIGPQQRGRNIFKN